MKKLGLMIITFSAVFTLAACGDNTVDNNSNSDWDAASNIQVYTRDTASGTRAGFFGGIDFDDAAEDDSLLAAGFVIKDNTGILTSMATDEYGIGYVSLASVDETIKGLSFEGVEPTVMNVINDTYGLKRPFNYVLRDLDDYTTDTERDISLAFIAFLHTTDGADIITLKGAVPLDSTDTWASIADQYPVCQEDNSDVTIKFGGSDSIQKIAEALSADFKTRCGNFVAEHDHTGSSDGFRRTQGSEKDGANAKHIGFASRPFKDSEVRTDGTQGQLAWDAIVAIVHLDNTTNNVTAETLKKIFSGEITAWDQLPE